MKKIRGFTLLELLIAAMIFSVIAITLYSAFSGGIRVWGRQKTSSDYGHGIRLALDGISRELRDAVNYSQPEGPFFSGEAQKVSFITQIKGELARVSYEFSRDVLTRNISFQKEGFIQDDKKAEALLTGLREVSFEYAYGGADAQEPVQWKDAWGDKASLPKGVKVILTFAKTDTKGKETLEIFRKTIFMPAGTLGKEE